MSHRSPMTNRARGRALGQPSGTWSAELLVIGDLVRAAESAAIDLDAAYTHI